MPLSLSRAKNGLLHGHAGRTRIGNLTVFRDPGKWNAEFTPYRRLADGFRPLEDCLRVSAGLRIMGGAAFPNGLAGAVYDGVAGAKGTLAKAALLNLYSVLTELKEPVGGRRPWFTSVRSVVAIGRERFIGVADPEMGRIVRRIKDDIKTFKDCKHTAAGNHFEGVKRWAPSGLRVLKSKMFSIKSTHDNANVQLTLAPAVAQDGTEVLLLDADTDESGELMDHLVDVFLHTFNGGSHPYDIHEYLLQRDRDRDLGYELV